MDGSKVDRVEVFDDSTTIGLDLSASFIFEYSFDNEMKWELCLTVIIILLILIAEDEGAMHESDKEIAGNNLDDSDNNGDKCIVEGFNP